jgi:hypothetical protein
MAQEPLPDGPGSGQGEIAKEEENEIKELVTSFVQNRPDDGLTRHDVVFRDLTVRGAGIGVRSMVFP